jgi:transposase
MNKPIRPDIAKGAVYPTEFREEAVRYWLSSGQTLAAVSADLGLTPDCLRSWRRQMESTSTQQTADADAAVPSTATAKELALAREIGELRRELEAMTRQRDILKKAISIFSEDKSINGGLK